MSRPAVLITYDMLPVVQRGLEAAGDVIRLWQADDRDALIAREAPRIRAVAAGGSAMVGADLIDRLPNLEIIANFGVGYDNVDARHAASRGVIVTHTPDVLTEEVADTAFGLLLMTARELSAAERHLRDGGWMAAPYPLTRGTLRGRTLGILGLGRIGMAIARRAEAFGLKIAYHNRRPVAGCPYPYHATPVALAAAVDTLMVVTPGGAETRHMINAQVLAALGPNGILVNIGRGSTVDEAALATALRDGTILAAGLDVFQTEPCLPQALMESPRAVLLPHVGSASVHTRDAMGQLVVDNIVSWFDTGRPVTPVPETPWPRPAG